MAVIINGNEIVLSGCVGDPSGWGFEDCFTAADVIVALARVGHNNDVVIRLNSGGGIATEGSAIHSALARHGGKKTIIIEGIAASAASIIAMAGDETVCALGAIIMSHLPSGMTVGTIADHEMQISALTAIGDAMATIYAAKTGRTAAECMADMKAETWMTADQAVEKGYADRVEGANDNAEPTAPAPFNYTLYANAPAKMVAMTKANHWTKQPTMAVQPTAAPAAPAATGTETPPVQEEDRMTTEAEIQTRIDAAVAAERAASAERERVVADREKAVNDAVTAATANAQAGRVDRAAAAEISTLCADAGVPTMAAALLREGVSVADAKLRVDAAGQITALVALAEKDPTAAKAMTAEFLAAGKTVAQAKEALFDKMASASDATAVSGQHSNKLEDPKAADKTKARAQSASSMEAVLKKSGLIKKEG